MYVIIETGTRMIVDFVNEIVDNNDGSFYDVEGDLYYTKDITTYHEIAEKPRGVRVNSHGYDPDKKTFFRLITPLELSKARAFARDKMRENLSVKMRLKKMSEQIEEMHLQEQELEYLFKMLNITEAATAQLFLILISNNMITEENIPSSLPLIFLDMLQKQQITEEELPSLIKDKVLLLQEEILKNLQEAQQVKVEVETEPTFTDEELAEIANDPEYNFDNEFIESEIPEKE